MPHLFQKLSNPHSSTAALVCSVEPNLERANECMAVVLVWSRKLNGHVWSFRIFTKRTAMSWEVLNVEISSTGELETFTMRIHLISMLSLYRFQGWQPSAAHARVTVDRRRCSSASKKQSSARIISSSFPKNLNRNYVKWMPYLYFKCLL